VVERQRGNAAGVASGVGGRRLERGGGAGAAHMREDKRATPSGQGGESDAGTRCKVAEAEEKRWAAVGQEEGRRDWVGRMGLGFVKLFIY
jgi:hypothetical protein